MGKRLLILSVTGLAFAAGIAFSHFYKGDTQAVADKKNGRKILYYYDPMHPSYTSDKPGIAPDCEMDLVPKYAEEAEAKPAAARKKERKILYYVDPMHPSYRSDKPGIAPDCNMKLEPVYAQEERDMDGAADDNAPVDAVHISPEKQQLIGVEYGSVEYGPAFQTVRAAAKVGWDENKVARVQVKYDGWIDEIFVNLVGARVRKRQPLATVYNPMSTEAQMDFIRHANRRLMPAAPQMRGQSNMATPQPAQVKASDSQPDSQTAQGVKQGAAPAAASTTDPNAGLDYEALLAGDRYRLQQMGFDDEVLATIAKTRTPVRSLTVYSPINGVVVERNAFPKQRVTPDTMYTIVDLSTVWVTADLFEYEAGAIQAGQSAVLSMPFMPGKRFKGKVDSILPAIDPTTRTLKVRLVFDNLNNALMPEMYGDVELRVGGMKRLMVAQSAVLDSGLRQVVFVDRGNGYFEPRDVKTGRRFGDRIEVLSGLKAGERIVTSGNFLIDSESQLKASRAGHDR
ncbi:MAG: hypothetical protein DMF61_19500 [Blastocatellia bacterium AA13]|nr:MAG: hypothetical protein DMF61_19500 [Blastocatellia bacterium AA13]